VPGRSRDRTATSQEKSVKVISGSGAAKLLQSVGRRSTAHVYIRCLGDRHLGEDRWVVFVVDSKKALVSVGPTEESPVWTADGPDALKALIRELADSGPDGAGAGEKLTWVVL